jgi:rubrerythrin
MRMDHLDIDKLFTLAAKREIEARDFYESVAKKMKDAAVREIFAQLSRDEAGHFETIEKFKHDPTMVMKISAPEGDWKVAESEKLPKLSVKMKPKEAIALAMKKEQQAVEFYRGLAGQASDAGVKSMMENLANMELSHKRRLETIFVDIGYPEAF